MPWILNNSYLHADKIHTQKKGQVTGSWKPSCRRAVPYSHYQPIAIVIIIYVTPIREISNVVAEYVKSAFGYQIHEIGKFCLPIS
jgi:hypothetical protein